jgi:predicted dithiol-disulfide oxidoreductase (DUF899 family)
MTSHALGTREEWLAARLELLHAEKELTRRSDELAQRRRGLPWVKVREGGDVFHTYSAYSRGCDALWAMWQWLDRAPLGRNEGDLSWFHRHDEYPSEPADGLSRS